MSSPIISDASSPISEVPAANPARLKVGIYCRISLDKRGDELGVQRQLDEARSIAKNRGWSVVAEYTDNSKSAFSKNVRRPQYEKMVADAKAGLIDGIIAWDLDRLTRQPRQIEDWCDMGEQRGFVLVTVDGSLDLSTENGRMFARIKASVARQESEHKAKRQRFSNDQRAQMGRPPHTGRAFGYNLDGTVIESEAHHVRKVFEKFVAGSGLHTIVRWLSEEGVKNTRGKSWGRVGVRDMLRNPRYIAERWMLRTQPDGSRVNEYIGKGDWDALIDEEVFRSAVHILNDPDRLSKFGGQGNARRYFGSGTFRCAECGALMRTGRSGVKNGGAPYRTYVCPKWHVVRKAEHIETVVHGAIRKRLTDPLVVAALAGEKSSESHVARLRDEANSIRRKLDQITIDYAEGVLSARQLKIATDLTEAKLVTVEAQLAKAGSSNALSALVSGVDPAEVWLQLNDVEAQVTILNALCTIRIAKQPQGARRPSPKNTEKHDAWLEGLVNSVQIDWHTAPHLAIV